MIKDGWYVCPYCRQKLFKVTVDAKANGIECKCKKCRKIINIKIEPLSHEH